MDIEQKYQETLDYLYSFIDYSLQKTFRYSPEKFDLGRMRDFMSRLGNPQNDYQIIHVAGTKGKGSVSALCANAIKESGTRVGLYTSPHLQDYTERIQVDGIPISPGELIDLVEEIKPQIEESPEITTFEITTALAFLYFARQEVRAAVIEVGLGGRLDATNVCTPVVTVITSISYDHTYLLGETLAEIAGEKSGIIKPGIPVIVAPQEEEALQVIRDIASERVAPLIQVGRDYQYRQIERSLQGQSLLVWNQPDPVNQASAAAGPVGQIQMILTIPLLGDHQVVNAATAFAALQVACNTGVQVSEAGIQKGFRSVHWPARFEILQHFPPVVIDSAHNRDSAKKLRAVLEDYYPGMAFILVFGASEDKDIPGMFAELGPGVKKIVTTKSTHPRAADPLKLVEMAEEIGYPAVATNSVEEAMEAADRLAGGEALILVTGSIFVAAAARSTWLSRLREEDFTFTGI
ncbi:MAG: bifunctional folylpolyglutamate synthase/dihydrofolate synthase [Chloroflexota bacterium]|nr:MAG: bifunctional folylpolyglutamate synthase/dihydrofolate synthase [Chloroflexota bacterium]